MKILALTYLMLFINNILITLNAEEIGSPSAVQYDDSDADNNLGYKYEQGDGVRKDYAEAAKWYRKSAEKNNILGINNLAYCYLVGQGVLRSNENAEYWYKKSADLGDSNAIASVGYFAYRRAKDNAEKIFYKENRYASYTASDKDRYIAQFMAQDNDFHDAMQLYHKAAIQGNLYAQTSLGGLYYLLENYKESVNWYRKAAECGFAPAQTSLGYCYHYGKGVPKSDTEAVKWYLKAADYNEVIALKCLSYCYELGQGVGRDLNKAEEYSNRYVAITQQGFSFRYSSFNGVLNAEALDWPDLIKPPRQEKIFNQVSNSSEGSYFRELDIQGE